MSILLTQGEFGELHDTDQPFVNKLEQGLNLTMESMQRYADTYGVAYYHLANPDLPIPPLEEMPVETQRKVATVLQEREKLAMENKAKRNAGEPIYRTGSAKLLHGLITDGYFKKPRTSKEAFLKLNPDIKAGALTEAHKKEIAKITATLSQGKFPKLLDKLDPEKGSTAVRFVVKGNTAIAAEGDEEPGNRQ